MGHRPSLCPYFICPDAKALQHVRPEGHADCDVGGIPTSRDEHAADARGVITGIERVPGRRLVRSGYSDSESSESVVDIDRAVRSRDGSADLAATLLCGSVHCATSTSVEFCPTGKRCTGQMHAASRDRDFCIYPPVQGAHGTSVQPLSKRVPHDHANTIGATRIGGAAATHCTVGGGRRTHFGFGRACCAA